MSDTKVALDTTKSKQRHQEHGINAKASLRFDDSTVAWAWTRGRVAKLANIAELVIT
jgi:hypothetical protein